jgi:hypothetical protein
MKKEIRKNAVKISFPFIVVMTLVLSTTLPVLADNTLKPNSALRLVQGEVISVATDNSTFIIQNGGQKQITIKVDEDTKYYIISMGKASEAVKVTAAKDKQEEREVKKAESNQFGTVAPKVNKAQSKPFSAVEPQVGKIEPKAKSLKPQTSVTIAYCGTDPNWLGRYGKEAQFSDIQVGDRIIAWIQTADNLATQILIIKAPVIQPVRGTITDVSDNSFTITPPIGAAVTLSWDENTRFVLKGFISVQSGQYAIAVYNRNTMIALTVDVQATAPATER